MVFQLGAGIERARYTSLVLFFCENLSNINTDGEINRDDINRMPDSLIVFCRVSRNFAAVKKMSSDALVVFAAGSQLVKMFIDDEL